MIGKMGKDSGQQKKAGSARKEIDEYLSSKRHFGGAFKLDEKGRIISPPNERLQRIVRRIAEPWETPQEKKDNF